MRLTASVVAILLATASSGWAFPNAGSLPAGDHGNFIEAAVKCGPHAHYVRGHRDKNHQYVKGRCIRDRRH